MKDKAFTFDVLIKRGNVTEQGIRTVKAVSAAVARELLTATLTVVHGAGNFEFLSNAREGKQ